MPLLSTGGDNRGKVGRGMKRGAEEKIGRFGGGVRDTGCNLERFGREG